ncbi:hypothetical protein [Thermococcus sp. 5-4]|uniref:hypothetical protein n=1 Tax=Thermococcus sp. 5-4 TaxID=2008440 RepID=UPI001D0552B9|nr:hypothetical protein [Thermococcus sp. 5-4]
MAAVFKVNWGRVAIYIGALTLMYALSIQMEALRVLMAPVAVLVAFLVAGEFIAAIRRKNEAFVTRLLGVTLAALFAPSGWNLPAAMIALGGGMAFIAPRLESHSRFIRGAGLLIGLYGISRLPPLAAVGSVFSYAGLFLFLGYSVAELGERYPWTEPVERNLLGLGALGAILGLYVAVRGSLSESHPELVFYGEWLVLLLGVIAAGSMVYSYISEKDPEAYLLSQWRKHEAKTVEKLGPELSEAMEAVEDFVVRGKKGPLVAFIAYYGSRLFDDRKRFEALVEKIADYRARQTSRLTPLWIRHAYERRELERRIKIVEEVFDELRTLMGWES